MFDPEKVPTFQSAPYEGCFAEGGQGGCEDKGVIHVRKSDYDQLLALRNSAIGVAVNYGGIEGDHHRAWVIDQMVRLLTGEKYEDVVTAAKAGEEGPDTYGWDIGIAP